MNKKAKKINKLITQWINEMILFISAIVSLIDLVPSSNPRLVCTTSHLKFPVSKMHRCQVETSLEKIWDQNFVIHVYKNLYIISTYPNPQRPQLTFWMQQRCSTLGCTRWWTACVNWCMIHAWHVCIGSPNPTSTYQTWHSPSSAKWSWVCCSYQKSHDSG